MLALFFGVAGIISAVASAVDAIAVAFDIAVGIAVAVGNAPAASPLELPSALLLASAAPLSVLQGDQSHQATSPTAYRRRPLKKVP